jgi:hypothetical protein
MNHF